MIKSTTGKWTPEEERLLREHYPALGLEGTTRLLSENGFHRSFKAVIMKAHNLGVLKGQRQAASTAPKWTPAEDKIVRVYYPTGGVKAAGEALQKAGFHRTRRSVQERVYTLGMGERRTRDGQSHRASLLVPRNPNPMPTDLQLRLDALGAVIFRALEQRPDLPLRGVIGDAMRAVNQDPTALEALAVELKKRRQAA